MTEKLDFSRLNAFARKNPIRGHNDEYVQFHLKELDSEIEFVDYFWSYVNEDDFEVEISGNLLNGFLEWQTPPAPAMFQIYKSFYSNGIIKEKGKRFGCNKGSVCIEKTELFNEKGALISVIDEHVNFGQFMLQDVLLFLQRNGHFKIDSGENRKQITFDFNTHNRQWHIKAINPNCSETHYVIDGETGEIINKNEYQIKS